MKVSSKDDHSNGGRVHTEGWGIRFDGAETCVYFEGKLEASFEMSLSGSPRRPHAFIAFTSGQWDDPNESIAMKPGHWDLIKERLSAYLSLKNEPFEIRDK